MTGHVMSVNFSSAIDRISPSIQDGIRSTSAARIAVASESGASMLQSQSRAALGQIVEGRIAGSLNEIRRLLSARNQ
jgi:hypothetical protein